MKAMPYFFTTLQRIGLICLSGYMVISCSRPQQQSIKSIDYLGQKPPGMAAELFADGLISSNFYEHSAPAFAPEGNTVLWTVIVDRYKPSYLLEMKRKNGVWTKPTKPAFSDSTADDFYPSYSVDGKKLFFSSRRKTPTGYPQGKGIRIWVVEKEADGWGTPMPFDTTVSKGEDYAHSVASNETIYFSMRREGGKIFDIACAKKSGNHYSMPESLPYTVNSTTYDDGPFIAPDESYLIFESSRPGGVEGSIDLYISFKKNDGTWGEPKNMGDKINTKFTERFARVSPDGKYLFFGSDRRQSPNSFGTDIYWIDAKIINELRNEKQ